MAGTKLGGIKTAKTVKAKFGDDWYHKMGALGGRVSSTGGFYNNRAAARKAGAIGGTISRRGDSKPKLPESESTCTFCNADGHSALYCSLRANVKRRKDIVLAKKRVEAEERAENMSKLAKINQRFGVKRPW